MIEEGQEQAEFDRGNRHHRAFGIEQAALERIEPPAFELIVELVARRGRAAARAAQHAADSRDQFARVERLDHIVVGADLEPDDAVGRLAPRGDEDHRQLARFDEVAAQREAVLAGHHDVEQDEVGGFAILRPAQPTARLGGGGGLGYGEPLTDQIVRQRFAQGGFVIDDEQPGRRSFGQCRHARAQG